MVQKTTDAHIISTTMEGDDREDFDEICNMLVSLCPSSIPKDGEMVDTKDCLNCWRLLGIEYQGHEVLGVKTVSRKTFLKLTGDLLRKEKRETDFSCHTQEDHDERESKRIFRLLQGATYREKDANGRIGRDTFRKFVKSCDIKYVNREEMGSLFDSISGRDEADFIDDSLFVRFLCKQIGRKRKDEEEEEDSAL